MGVAITTAGVIVGYAVGNLGTKPTEFKEIPDIKSTPDFNVEDSGIDCTVLSETVAKQYTQGLKDYGSSIEFTANLTKRIITVWNKFYNDVKTAQNAISATGNECGWIAIHHPKLGQDVILPCTPSALGLPAMEVDSVVEETLRVTPLAGAEFVETVTITPDTGSDG